MSEIEAHNLNSNLNKQPKTIEIVKQEIYKEN